VNPVKSKIPRSDEPNNSQENLGLRVGFASDNLSAYISYYIYRVLEQKGLWERKASVMAQRVNVVLVDDLDGSDAAETISFALDGVDYDIDLSDKHAGELRKSLSVYVGHARRTGGRRRGGRRSRARSTGSGVAAADIRAWARENGWDVPERGRVSAEIREAYGAAN
jgi:hypothetical protein